MHVLMFTQVLLCIDGELLQQVHEYLGGQIDGKLKMDKHIDAQCKKVQQKLGIMKKLCKCIDVNSYFIYKVTIRSHVDYGDYIVDSSTQKYIYR